MTSSTVVPEIDIGQRRGADVMDGGWDRYGDVHRLSAAVAISLITDAAGGGDAEDDDIDNIENITGSEYDDTSWATMVPTSWTAGMVQTSSRDTAAPTG